MAKLFNAQILEYTITEGFDLSVNKESLGDGPIHATTKTGESLVITGSILFKIDKTNAPELWENIGEKFVSKVIRPISRSKIASTVSTLTFDQLKNERPLIEKQLKEELNTEFHDKGLACEGLLLSEIKKV